MPLLGLAGLEVALFRPTAFATAAALFGALALNLSLQPALASYALGGRRREPRRNPLDEPLSHGYRRLLETALRSKRLVVGVFVIFVAAGALAYPHLGKEFVPPLDEGAVLRCRGRSASVASRS